MNKIKIAIISLAALFFLWIASWFGIFSFINSDKVIITDSTPSITQEVEQKVSISVSNESGELISTTKNINPGKTSAFSLLSEVAEDQEIPLITTQYDFGVFVNAIGDVQENNKMFWKYYINGTEGTVAADNYILNAGDKVEWKYEEVKNE